MKQPSTRPQITTLRKFVVNHKHVDFQSHVHHLSKWVRRIISHSHLEHLELVIDGFEYFRGPYLNYGGLVEHISHKHGCTIRILRLMHGYTDSATIALLCQKCPNLEEASLGVNMSTLVGLVSDWRPSSLTRPSPIAQVPSKSCFIVEAATSRLPRLQRQVVQGPQRLH